MYFAYTFNRICHSNQSKTPFELYLGYKPSVRHLKPFSIVAYVGVPSQLRNKLEPKARKGAFIGYSLKTRGYRIWLSEEWLIEIINVSFRDGDSALTSGSGAALGPPCNSKSDSQESLVSGEGKVDYVPIHSVFSNAW